QALGLGIRLGKLGRECVLFFVSIQVGISVKQSERDIDLLGVGGGGRASRFEDRQSLHGRLGSLRKQRCSGQPHSGKIRVRALGPQPREGISSEGIVTTSEVLFIAYPVEKNACADGIPALEAIENLESGGIGLVGAIEKLVLAGLFDDKQN